MLRRFSYFPTGNRVGFGKQKVKTCELYQNVTDDGVQAHRPLSIYVAVSVPKLTFFGNCYETLENQEPQRLYPINRQCQPTGASVAELDTWCIILHKVYDFATTADSLINSGQARSLTGRYTSLRSRFPLPKLNLAHPLEKRG